MDVTQERLTPWVTYFLIAVNAAVFVYELAASGSILGPSDSVIGGLSFYWPTVLAGQWGLLFTSIFAHASWEHIVGNMAFLLAFGPKVENLFASNERKALGHTAFLVFYLMGGAVASFGFAATGGYDSAALGASGAIAFVLGIFWFVFPRSIVTVPLSTQKVRTIYYLGFWFLMQAYFALYGGGGAVAYAAHVWGFIFGVFIAWGYRFKRYQDVAFGLLERPWKLSWREALDALGALVG